MILFRIRFFLRIYHQSAPLPGKKLVLGAVSSTAFFTSLLHAQMLEPTPPPNSGSAPPSITVPSSIPLPTANPNSNVPSVSVPPALPTPFQTPAQILTAPSGSLPSTLPAPFQTPSQPFTTPPNSLPTPHTIVAPSGSLPASLPTPNSSIPPLIEPTPFPSVPPSTGTTPRMSPISPSGAAPSSSFPSYLLPAISNTPSSAIPIANIPRVRIAKATELGIHSPKMTLDNAIQYALRHNADVLNAVQQIRLTRGQVITARAELLPHLVATSAFSEQSIQLANPPSPNRRTSIPVVGPDGTITDTTVKGNDFTINNNSWNVNLSVQQLLFDGGKALATTQAAKYQEDLSFFMLRSVIDNVIAQVKSAFFQVILNRALILAQEQSVSLLENQLEDQENRFQAGTVPKFNVLQAQVALANAVPPLITARNNLRISQYQLVQLLGMNYTGDPTQIPFNVVGTLEVKFRKIFPEESIRVGLTRNPSLKAQRENILSQAASVTAAISGYFPKITFGGGYLIQNNVNYQNLGNTVEGWFFGFNGAWNIFDGLNTYGNVMTAKAQLEQAKIGYDNSVRTVILNIQQDISNLQQAQEIIESQQASVVQATEALRLSRERLDAGAGTQLDVLNAQVALLQAQTTLLQAQFNYIQALAQYDAALSLNTQYAESFRDPLNDKEKWRFAKLNGAGYSMPPLPRVYRKQDPLTPLLGASSTPQPNTVHSHAKKPRQKPPRSSQTNL